MAGRVTKLTPDVQRRICDAIAAGNYYEAACAYGGVAYQTFSVWMAKGDEGKAPYREFREAVLKAEADAEVRVVALWQKHMPETWQACRDFLARRFSDRWGPKEKHEVSGPAGGALRIETLQIIPPEGADGEAGPG